MAITPAMTGHQPLADRRPSHLSNLGNMSKWPGSHLGNMIVIDLTIIGDCPSADGRQESVMILSTCIKKT